MQEKTFATVVPDGTALHTRMWTPDGSPKAIVQIAHGLAEHSARYARFAEALTRAGYAVYADDHRGHGVTNPPGEGHGYLADEDGFATVVDDLHAVTDRARADYPGLPVFFFGHSMGALLGRAYAAKFGDDLAGLVLSGVGGDQGLLGKAAALIAGAECRVRGRRHPSAVLDRLASGTFGNAFRPNRTKLDWLSRDADEVDKYIADPMCGNVLTCGFWADLLKGVAHIKDPKTTARVPKGLPVHLVSGSMCPVGEKTKGVEQVARQYRDARLAEVTTRYYIGARHELLNETNREEVTTDLIAWFDAHLPDHA